MTDNIELIILTYPHPQTAGERLRELPKLQRRNDLDVITAAALVKTLDGKTSVEDTLDLSRKKGGRYGALAGGLLAVLAPPIGAAGVLASMVAGAAAGRAVSRKPKKNFPADFLRELLDGLRGGSSALVILVNQERADEAAAVLEALGGQLIRQPLDPDSLQQLAATLGTGDVETVTSGPLDYKEQVAARVTELVREQSRRSGPQFNRVLVIINPASGQDKPILNTLNTVFNVTGVDWDVVMTKRAGDARRFAADAGSQGYDLVAIYGGDGSVTETASGLIDSDVPLAILPGGTNNVMSVELGIPRPLVEAAALIGGAPAQLRRVDMGKCNDHYFILRVGIGYEAVINEGADREAKDKYGGFAYTLAGLKALRNPPIGNYEIVIDGGEPIRMEGLWCLIANSANLGFSGVDLVQGIDVGDGLLDVVMVRRADLESLVEVASSVARLQRVGEPLPHWRARHVKITADPPQAVTGDGELWEPTPLEAAVIPAAVQILVPA